jgi:hypothetical protein
VPSTLVRSDAPSSWYGPVMPCGVWRNDQRNDQGQLLFGRYRAVLGGSSVMAVPSRHATAQRAGVLGRRPLVRVASAVGGCRRGQRGIVADNSGVAIRLLGGFEVTVADHPVAADAWRLRKAKTLVKLLALARGQSAAPRSPGGCAVA